MAKNTMQVVVTDPKRFVNDLRDVYAFGIINGVDFMARVGGLRNGARKPPEPKLSASAIARYAISLGAVVARTGTRPVVASALPEKTGTADADRLRAAMGDMAPIEACRAAGLKDSASIRNVTNKGAPLAGKLLAWVEMQEREAGR